jgi:hypothetical protein
MVPSAKWRQSTSKSWRASMFIVCRWRIKRDVSWKIRFGRACAADMLDDIDLLHPWCFVMVPPCHFCH